VIGWFAAPKGLLATLDELGDTDRSGGWSATSFWGDTEAAARELASTNVFVYAGIVALAVVGLALVLGRRRLRTHVILRDSPSQ